MATISPDHNFNKEEDLELTLGEDAKPLVSPGKYQVVCTGWERKPHFGRIKLYVKFQICDGPYIGLKLFKPYNWYDPPRSRSDLMKDLLMLSGKRGLKNMKLPLSLFKNKVLEVVVRTVIQDRKQVRLPENLQYSVVDQIRNVSVGCGDR